MASVRIQQSASIHFNRSPMLPPDRGERPTHFLQQFRRGQVTTELTNPVQVYEKARFGRGVQNWTGKRGLKITRL